MLEGRAPRHFTAALPMLHQVYNPGLNIGLARKIGVVRHTLLCAKSARNGTPRTPQ